MQSGEALPRKETPSIMSDDLANNKVVLIILAILISPVAAYLKTKDTKTTIINVVLWFLCVVPGIVHALYLVLKE